uniref:alpha/beta hydrolase n=1 Tax=Corynebacterium variabile TaxID=1727 RepID=UPI0037356D45
MSTHAARRVAPRSVRVAATALVAALPLTAVAVNYSGTTPVASAEEGAVAPAVVNPAFATRADAEANKYVPEDEAGWRQWVYRQEDETNEDGTPKPNGGKAGQRYGRMEELAVTSPSMGNRQIPVVTIRAKDNPENAPTIYLLNGADGGTGRANWLQQTSAIEFYGNELGNVNVVIPMAGAFTYYLDWVSPAAGNGDEVKPGPQKWETFLTKELPGPIESTLGANDQRGIIGFSMSALSAMVFAQHNPGMYQAVAGFSGHYQTFTEVDHRLHGMTLQRGGATPAQMLGPAGGKYAAYNDAVINAGKLRGTKIYASNSSGLAGETDMPGYYTAQGINPAAASMGAAQLQVEGGVIEAATNLSTHSLKAALDKEGIPATG